MKDLITVIVNVYNGEKFINKCLDSIINQTYKKLEILIINDGSTDNTLSICKKYKDKRIRIITTENMWISLSRNVGIDNAKGKYLYFIDADDYIEPDTIEYLYNLCKEYNVPFSTCKPIVIFDYNVNVPKTEEKVKVLTSEEMLKILSLDKDREGTIWNKLIRKDLFNNIRFEARIVSDVAVVYKFIIEAKKIVYSNQIKYYYLRHINSITGKGDENTSRSIDMYKAFIERYYYIKKLYPNMKENYICLIRMFVTFFCREDEKLQEFLKEQKVMKFYRKIFTFRVFTCDISFKEKMKILLFTINPKLCKLVNRRYQTINYKYKF